MYLMERNTIVLAEAQTKMEVLATLDMTIHTLYVLLNHMLHSVCSLFLSSSLYSLFFSHTEATF